MFTRFFRSVLFPTHMIPAPPRGATAVEGLERLTIETPEGEVEGWFLSALGVARASRRPLLLFAHGNGELIDYWPRPLRRYRELGLHVFLPEYRGYGRSAGAPSEAAITEDFEHFYDRVAARENVDERRIVFHGRSLGGGAVCNLARRRPPAGLILESTFESVTAMARRWLVPGFAVPDTFDNLGAVREYRGPLLVMHGAHDELIPLSHARSLAAAARDAELRVLDGGHNDVPQDAKWWRAVETLLDRAGVLDPPPLDDESGDTALPEATSDSNAR